MSAKYLKSIYKVLYYYQNKKLIGNNMIKLSLNNKNGYILESLTDQQRDDRLAE